MRLRVWSKPRRAPAPSVVPARRAWPMPEGPRHPDQDPDAGAWRETMWHLMDLDRERDLLAPDLAVLRMLDRHWGEGAALDEELARACAEDCTYKPDVLVFMAERERDRQETERQGYGADRPGVRRVTLKVHGDLWMRRATEDHRERQIDPERPPYAGVVRLDAVRVYPWRCRTTLGWFLAEHVATTLPGHPSGRVKLGLPGGQGYGVFEWPLVEHLDVERYFDGCAAVIEASGRPLLDVAGAGVPPGWLVPDTVPVPATLLQAVTEGDADAVRVLLKNRAEAEPGFEDALKAAVATGQLEILALLLATNAGKVEVRAWSHFCRMAVYTGFLPVLDLLLGEGAPVDEVTVQSVMAGTPRYLEAGCLVQTEDPGVWLCPTAANMTEVLRRLLRAGAPVTLEHRAYAREQGLTDALALLEEASRHQDAEALRDLLPPGAQSAPARRL